MRLLPCFGRFGLPLLLAAGCLFPASAQIVNIEQGRVSPDSVNKLTGKGGVNFSMFNRNAGRNNPNNYLQLTLTGDLAYNSRKHTYLLLNYFNYLLVNYDNPEQRNTVAETGYTHFRINFLRERSWSYELFGQVQIDKARGLELRSLVGAYLRHRITRADQQVLLAVGTGPMHEHEEWRNPEQNDRLEVSNLVKSTSYLSARIKPQENLAVNSIVYYQVGYDRGIAAFRNRLSGDVSLSVKFSKAVAFRTNFNCTYEDRPIVPVTRFVYTLANGVTVAF